MNKTAHTELHRLFLIEGLPEPLTPASAHLQLFDNYIDGTRMRLRSIRDPYTNTWIKVLQQRFRVDEHHGAVSKLSEIYLNDAEYGVFERFEGREIRKNRYFHEIDNREVTFDVFLGQLWGLNTARVDFVAPDEMRDYMPPPTFVLEVTNENFFDGVSLVTKTFADVQAEFQRIAANR